MQLMQMIIMEESHLKLSLITIITVITHLVW